MKIALFASAFYPHSGGVEEVVRQSVHAYRRAGHEAIVLTNRWPRDLPAVEEFEGIAVHRLALRSPGEDLKSRLTFALTSAPIQRRIDQLMSESHIDLVHVHCVSSNGFYALGSCRNLGLPLVVTTHGERTMDANQTFQSNIWFQNVLRDCLSKAQYVSACSRDTLKDAEEFLGQDLSHRSEVVHSGIRVADFDGAPAYSHPRPYILGLGRMVPQKGFDILLRAFDRAHCPDHDLILAGDGNELEGLKALSREFGLENRVHFFGRADRNQAVSLFKGCSFFVLPSRREPQGIVSLEAMCAEKAVVAARVGGVPEIVLDNETGLLFPGEDVGALSQHLGSLVREKSLRERLAKAGRERALRFDWDNLAEQYLAVYRRVLTDFSERQ